MNDKNIQDPKAMNALKGALISFLEFLRDLSKKAEHFSVYGPDIERLSKLLKEEQEVQIKTGIEVYEQGKSIVENEKNIDKCSENIVEIDEKLLEIEQCLKDALILNSMNAQEYMIDMIENNPHETDWIFVPIKEESKDVFYMYNLTLLNKPTKEQELINSNGIIKIVLTKNNEFIILLKIMNSSLIMNLKKINQILLICPF